MGLCGREGERERLREAFQGDCALISTVEAGVGGRMSWVGWNLAEVVSSKSCLAIGRSSGCGEETTSAKGFELHRDQPVLNSFTSQRDSIRLWVAAFDVERPERTAGHAAARDAIGLVLHLASRFIELDVC